MAGSIEPSQISTGAVTAWICAGVVIILIMVAVIWKKASNIRRGLKSDNDDRKNGRINNQTYDVELYTASRYFRFQAYYHFDNKKTSLSKPI